jgi:hypothetical protein
MLVAPVAHPQIVRLDPPEQGFFSKKLDCEGILIKAYRQVADEALFVACQRIEEMLKSMSNARLNLVDAGAELHIIGRHQRTSDLPDYQSYQGKPYEGDLTIDQRTRGLGGNVVTSCGEENLLRLVDDRYRGRDICVHEFAHTIQNSGLSDDLRQQIVRQYEHSLAMGLWKRSYASVNAQEFFAELSMWYFGTHGDLAMEGPKPATGPPGLRDYDAQAFDLLDAIYTGRLPIARDSHPPAKRLLLQSEGKVRSADASRKAQLVLVNRDSGSYRIYWLDYDGKRKGYGTLGPHEKKELQTFISHPWLLCDDAGHPFALFVAEQAKSIAFLP